MGMDLGFVSTDSPVEVPENFQWRFARRGEFWGLWLDKATKYQCGDHPEERDCHLYCVPSLSRVVAEDFPALRQSMTQCDLPQVFFEIVDWLEANPSVYLEYS